ncbi:MAG: hypothetical protein M1833_001868 [Piccolia ochrophora]|nr:MAG: hypothetical protein M1833_001868 [Piccolia ochrophora]
MQLDPQNTANLRAESTENGVDRNLKWGFSDSKTRLLNGGVDTHTDLPPSKNIASAQQHLKKGASRELHWHRVLEWGFVYVGSVLISAVDEYDKNQVARLNVSDIWYFSKGVAHTINGLEEENEYLLTFDDGDFESTGRAFMVDDWIAHTPKDILAKNFGVNASVFDNTPKTDPYILPTNADEWLYFHKGYARATVFEGGALARTFDFSAGDTAVFPNSSGSSNSFSALSHPSDQEPNHSMKLSPLGAKPFGDRGSRLDRTV